MRQIFLIICLAVALGNVCSTTFAQKSEPKTKTAWTVPEPQLIRLELEHWAQALQRSEQTTEKKSASTDEAKPEGPTAFDLVYQDVLASWDFVTKLSGQETFDKLVESMRRLSPAIGNYLKTCDALAWRELPFGQPLVLPQLPLQAHLGLSLGLSQSTNPMLEGLMSGDLTDNAKRPGHLVATLRYYLALRLVQARLFDEADTILDEMTPENSVDPAGVLITRAIVCNHLSQSEKGLAAIQDFRAFTGGAMDRGSTEENAGFNPGETIVPRRFVELAKLLEFDLKKQKESEDNPQQISRKMDDVRRRLGKGRTDDDTQQAEQDVMKSLERLIEKIEKQCEQQDSLDGEGRQGNQGADDSRRMAQKAPGNIDRRDFKDESDWGNLPPKEREETLLKIEKEFPAHYRDIVEQYFREMASQNH